MSACLKHLDFGVPLFSICFALGILVVTADAAVGPVYPLKASANNRYLVDQNGTAVLMVGDAPHTLISNLATPDAAYYLSNRAAHGVNTLWVELLCSTYVAGRPNGSLIDGVTVPFTNHLPSGDYDLTSPNDSYWSHVDLIVNMAATNGIQVLLDSFETGGWTDVALANGTNRCRMFGRFLGNRYKTSPNILWITGNDFDTWYIPTNDAVVTAIALGIKDMDPNHIHTVELNEAVSQSLGDPNWWPIVSANGVYTYFTAYDETLVAYNQSNFVPTFLLEGAYEYEAYYGAGGTPNNLRRQEYWSLLSGALAGHIYGNHWTWTFDSGWQSYLDTPGVRQLAYFKAFFVNRAWYNLVPDQNHTTLIAGYGTYSGGNTLNEENDYVTAARTAEGSLAVIYTPTNHTLIVDMSRVAGPSYARWFDPTAGAFYMIGGSPFENTGTKAFIPPGCNADGDGDWVLVLETQSIEMVPPEVTINAPLNGATVSNIITLSANASDNVDVVGVQFQVDGQNVGTEALSEPYAAAWDTRSFSNGMYVVRAIARDAAGNRSTNAVSVSVINPSATSFLVAAYPLSEGIGAQTADASGNGNTGTLSGPSWTTAGRYGSALVFAGTSWVTVNDTPSLDFTNGITVEAWVYPTNVTGTWTTVLLKEAPANLVYMLQGDPVNHPNLYILTANGLHGIAGAWPLALNTWTHVAGTYDGNALRLFTNGILAASQAVSGNIVRSSGPLRFGGNSVWGEYFQGSLDEIRIYSRALTQSEIQGTMNTPIRPVVTLSAPAQTADQIASMGFAFFISATAPAALFVEQSSNSISWEKIGSFQYTNGQMQFRDLPRPDAAKSFYRVRQP